MNPELSIIIPVYQAEKYLRDCLSSVLNQSFENFELILIDDGSTDESASICDEYAKNDSRILVIHQENKGQSAARNKGLKLAKGEFVGFIDNDDRIEPEMFALLLKLAKGNNTDITSCSYSQLNPDGEIVYPQKIDETVYSFNNYDGMKEFLSREKLNIYVWTKIYKRSFLEKNSIRFEEGKIDEDFLFNFQAYKYSNKSLLVSLPKYIYTYRLDSTSRSYSQTSLSKYLTGTMYRTDKILNETQTIYPDLTYLANRQKIIYSLGMLDVIFQSNLDVKNYYDEIILYLKENAKQLIDERNKIRNNLPGLLLLLLLPKKIYFCWRKSRTRY